MYWERSSWNLSETASRLKCNINSTKNNIDRILILRKSGLKIQSKGENKVPAGLEPAASRVWSERDNHYTTEPPLIFSRFRCAYKSTAALVCLRAIRLIRQSLFRIDFSWYGLVWNERKTISNVKGSINFISKYFSGSLREGPRERWMVLSGGVTMKDARSEWDKWPLTPQTD